MANERKDIDAQTQIRFVYEEVERQILNIFTEDRIKSIAQAGKEGMQLAMDLLTELSTELTGVQSFKIVPKPPMQLDVEIGMKKGSSIPLKQKVAPLVELDAVVFAEQVHFGAQIDKEKNGLRLNIDEGISARFNLGTLLGLQTVPIKGSALLARQDGKLVLIGTTVIPGTTQQINITVPIKTIFDHAKKQMK